MKCVIIGLPGSGKSTFATKLGKKLHIPVHHLDRDMFDHTGKKRASHERAALQKATLREREWIIEGCSISTLEGRFSEASHVIYFRLPRMLCLWRLLKRMLFDYKKLAETGCFNRINWELISYMWTFHKEKGPIIETLRQKYPHVHFYELDSASQAKSALQLLLN